jgi:hypothetical protein
MPGRFPAIQSSSRGGSFRKGKRENLAFRQAKMVGCSAKQAGVEPVLVGSLVLFSRFGIFALAVQIIAFKSRLEMTSVVCFV